jgi:hypothetical protein
VIGRTWTPSQYTRRIITGLPNHVVFWVETDYTNRQAKMKSSMIPPAYYLGTIAHTIKRVMKRIVNSEVTKLHVRHLELQNYCSDCDSDNEEKKPPDKEPPDKE